MTGPSIDIDEAILVDYILRAADLAVMPPSWRRALAETAAEPITGPLGDVPADWDLRPETDASGPPTADPRGGTA